MPSAILTLNAGSSSIKFALFECGSDQERLVSHGSIENIGTAPHFKATAPDGAVLKEKKWRHGAALKQEALLKYLLEWINSHLGDESLYAVGHRIVHGGRRFAAPVIIGKAVYAELEKLIPLAPLHQPHNLAAVKAVRRLRSDLPQVACFDTSFHHDMPEVAARLPLPHKYVKEGLRRYGFHGISYEFISGKLRQMMPTLAKGRIVVAHLGNGASLCAINDGRSMDTTMSLTALDGLMMGTRCGSLDPGVILYLQQVHGLPVATIEKLLYNASGLLGVSGISNDMQTLLASTKAAAREAIELFVYDLAKHVGAMTASLGGIDGFVFSGGIGEHAAPIRAALCKQLTWLGIECDGAANDRHATLISSPRSRIPVYVIATDEEAMIARHTAQVLKDASGPLKTTATGIPA